MDLLRDIPKFLKDNKEHNLKIEVSWDGVTIYLDYDPDKRCKEDNVIPIHYTTLENFAYIPMDKLIDRFKPVDYGITLDEIKIIKDIMEYLEANGEEITELCEEYDWEFRETKTERECKMEEENIPYED